jgi:hypothetical protein
LIQIGLSELRKLEIKYGWKVFEIRNNFTYTDFLRFKMNFELKFIETSMSLKQGKIDWNFLRTRILIKTWPTTSFLNLIEKKNKFPAERGPKI